MRLAFFTDVFPFPLIEGGKVAQFYVLQELAREHEVILISIVEPGMEEAIENIKQEIPRLNVYTIKRGITVKRKQFFGRLRDRVLWELNKKFNTLDTPNGIATHSLFLDPVQARPEEQVTDITKIFTEINADIIQVDFIDNADVALLLPAHTKKIIVAHDLRFTSVMQASNIINHSSEYGTYLRQYVEKKENAFLKLYDAAIVFSQEDKDKLNQFEVKQVFTSPFAINTKAKVISSTAKYDKLIFLGGDMHTPNLQAVQWFASAADTILSATGLPTCIVGKWTSYYMDKLKPHTAIKFMGFVEDIEHFASSAIMILPLQIGSGIRTKLLEAFAMGIPVISTALGAEGIGVQDDIHYLRAETSEEFLQQVQYTIKNSTATQERVAAARELVVEKFSPEVVARKRLQIFSNVLAQDHT